MKIQGFLGVAPRGPGAQGTARGVHACAFLCRDIDVFSFLESPLSQIIQVLLSLVIGAQCIHGLEFLVASMVQYLSIVLPMLVLHFEKATIDRTLKSFQ